MKKLNLAILVIALVFALSACSGAPAQAPQTPEPSESQNWQVTDDNGVTHDFSSAPTRIVSLSPSNTEILFAIGAGDLMVGVDEYSNRPEEVESLPKLGTGVNLNIEEVLALTPDLVIMGKMGQTIEQYEQMTTAGAKVFTVDAQSINDTYNSIEILGQVTKHEKEASDLIASMQKTFDEVHDRCASRTPLNVYVEVSPLQYGLWAASVDTFMHDLVTLACSVNVFMDFEGWQQVSEEQVIAKNPDVILTVSADPGAVEEIMARKGWENISAIKNGKVVAVNPDDCSRPGPSLAAAALEFEKAIYGE